MDVISLFVIDEVDTVIGDGLSFRPEMKTLHVNFMQYLNPSAKKLLTTATQLQVT